MAADLMLNQFFRESRVTKCVITSLNRNTDSTGKVSYSRFYFLMNILVHFMSFLINETFDAVSVEEVNIVERINENITIFHQLFKKVWPATQRDAVFWSYKCRVPNQDDQDAQDIWIVCNHSTDHSDVPVSTSYAHFTYC